MLRLAVFPHLKIRFACMLIEDFSRIDADPRLRCFSPAFHAEVAFYGFRMEPVPCPRIHYGSLASFSRRSTTIHSAVHCQLNSESISRKSSKRRRQCTRSYVHCCISNNVGQQRHAMLAWISLCHRSRILVQLPLLLWQTAFASMAFVPLVS